MHTSPGSPTGNGVRSAPAGSTTRTSVSYTGSPTVPGLCTPERACGPIVATIVTSVRP
jgi:hypothetical protein